MTSPIAVAGDWHGSRDTAVAAIRRAADAGARTLWQLGDFGVWGGTPGRAFLAAVVRACDEYDIDIAVVPGNHEDDDLRLRYEAEGVPGTDRVRLIPRGGRFDSAAGRVVALGGAPSMDRDWRTEGRNWWPGEEITVADADRTAAGGAAEIMLAHDSPGDPWWTPKVAHICRANPFGFPADVIADAARGRELLTRVVEKVRPRLYLHGHYHVYDTAETPTGRIVSLAADGAPGSLILLDPDNLEQEVLP